MGAWGLGSFENDDALDWVVALESAEGSSFLAQTFGAVLDDESGYPEAPECSMALAAAEVVAALKGYPAEDLPDEVSEWVRGKAAPEDALVDQALESLAVILDQSELKELWEETDEYANWEANVNEIQSRLGK